MEKIILQALFATTLMANQSIEKIIEKFDNYYIIAIKKDTKVDVKKVYKKEMIKLFSELLKSNVDKGIIKEKLNKLDEIRYR